MIITGGMGFIGGHLAKRLPDAKMWDRKLSTDYIQDIPLWWSKWSNVLPMSGIIHLAASTYLTEGYDKQIIDDNINLPKHIYDNFYKQRIVYASSAAVYNLNNLYAYSKKYAEDLFSDCNATGLRYYNVYGENDNGVVGKLIDCCLNGKLFHLHGGNQTRDFIYVDDVVQATIDAIDSNEKIIEVGTGVGTTIFKLMEMVEQIVGKKLKFQQHPFNCFESAYSVCPEPLKEFTKLEEGLIKTIESHIKK